MALYSPRTFRSKKPPSFKSPLQDFVKEQTEIRLPEGPADYSDTWQKLSPLRQLRQLPLRRNNTYPKSLGIAKPQKGPAASGSVQALAKTIAEQYGWSGNEWAALVELVRRESGWNPNAANPRSSARGLFQKMTSIHGALEPTVEGQIMWGLNYIRGRYGSPSRALAFHNRNNWY
jgi:hypothetical protein